MASGKQGGSDLSEGEEKDEMLKDVRLLKSIPIVDADDPSRFGSGSVFEDFNKKVTEVKSKLERDGFIAEKEIPTPHVKLKIIDPLYNENPPTKFYFRGIHSESGKGATKYSAIDLFGAQLSERYWVSDSEKFRAFMSARLTELFHRKNPSPDRGIKTAFTHLLHGMSMHWEGCSELRSRHS